MDSCFTKPWRNPSIHFARLLDCRYPRVLAFFELRSLRYGDSDHLTSCCKPMKPVLFFETFGSLCDSLIKWVIKLFKTRPFVVYFLINLI
jgi:hypothetical protein